MRKESVGCAGWTVIECLTVLQCERDHIYQQLKHGQDYSGLMRKFATTKLNPAIRKLTDRVLAEIDADDLFDH